MEKEASLKTKNPLTAPQHFGVTIYNGSILYIFLNYQHYWINSIPFGSDNL